jgi:dCMP deaminase
VFFGYNGFPSQLQDTEERLENRDLKLQYTIHAEMNAILNAKRNVEGFTAYTTFVPCDRCAIHLIQSGISRVVSPHPDRELAERWRDSINRTLRHFSEAQVRMDWYDQCRIDA